MARAPVPRIGRQAGLRPVAAPVDTFVRPQAIERSPLHDVAASLSGLSNGLQQWAAKREADQSQADALRGEAEFYKNNQQGYAEAVREGKIPAYASKDFVTAYKNAEGTGLGFRFAQDFTGAYALWDGKGTADPEAFDQFFGEYAAEYLADIDDPDVLEGLLPRFKQAAFNLHQQHLSERAERFYNDAAVTNSAAVAAGIDAASDEGLASAEGTDYEGLWSEAMVLRERALASGMRREDFDKQVMGTFAAKALEHGDHRLLEMLDRELPGTGVRYSDTPEGMKMKAEATSALMRLAKTRETETNQAQDRADKIAGNEATTRMIDGLAENPLGYEIDEGDYRAAAKVNPDVRLKVREWRKQLAEGGVEDPAALREVYRELAEGGGQAAVMRALDHGIITSPSTLAELSRFAKTFDEAGGGKVLTNATVKSVMDTLRKRTMDKSFTGNLFDPGGLTDAGLAVQHDYRIAMLQWAAQNPNASEEEIHTAAARIGKLVLDGVQTEFLEKPTVTRPEGAKETIDNPFAEEAAAVQSPPEPTPVVAPDPAGFDQRWSQVNPQAIGEEWRGDSPPSIDSLDPETRQLFENYAKQFGIDPELYVKRTHEIIQRRLQQGEPQAPEPVAEEAPESPMDVRLREMGEQYPQAMQSLASAAEPPAFDSLGFFVRQAIAGEAGKFGIEPQELINRAWELVNGQQGGDEGAAGAIQEQLGSLLEAIGADQSLSALVDGAVEGAGGEGGEAASVGDQGGGAAGAGDAAGDPKAILKQSFLTKGKDTSHVDGLKPEFATRLAAAVQDPDMPKGIQIYSGHRSEEHQARLWKAALKKYGSAAAARKWVAPPGKSNHNHGGAADLMLNGKRLDRLDKKTRQRIHEVMAKHGLHFRMAHEPWHVEIKRG